jgi:hypothetical protein
MVQVCKEKRLVLMISIIHEVSITNMKKCLLVGREKRTILQDSVKCVLHIRSEVKIDTFVNSALFRLF